MQLIIDYCKDAREQTIKSTLRPSWDFCTAFLPWNTIAKYNGITGKAEGPAVPQPDFSTADLPRIQRSKLVINRTEHDLRYFFRLTERPHANK